MTGWTSEERGRIEAADELRIASLRRDGTLWKPVTIWVVRLGGDLYVRSVNGRSSGWFRGTQVRREGKVQAGGVEKDVTFVEADEDVADQIDDAYRTKYRRYAASIVDHTVRPEARGRPGIPALAGVLMEVSGDGTLTLATLKLVPRS